MLNDGIHRRVRFEMINLNNYSSRVLIKSIKIFLFVNIRFSLFLSLKQTL